jgi:hypothetical protein
MSGKSTTIKSAWILISTCMLIGVNCIMVEGSEREKSASADRTVSSGNDEYKRDLSSSVFDLLKSEKPTDRSQNNLALTPLEILQERRSQEAAPEKPAGSDVAFRDRHSTQGTDRANIGRLLLNQ